MEQKETVKVLVITPIIIVSLFIWAFLLNASNVTIQSLVVFENFDAVISSLLSFNFIAFLIFFSVTYAILIALTRIFAKRLLQTIALISFIFSALIFLVIFPNLFDYWLVGLFYLISLLVVIETSFIKFEEMKSFISPRVTSAAMSQGLLVVGAGIFIATLVFVFPNQGPIVENFEEKIFSTFTPEEITKDIADSTAQIIIQTQTETLSQIISNPSFSALSGKEDTEVAQFVAIMLTLYDKVQTPEYKAQLIEKIELEQNDKLENVDLGSLIEKTKEKIPLFSLIENFFWVFASLSMISLFFLVSNVIIKPFGIFFGIIFITIVQMIKKYREENKRNTPPIQPLPPKKLDPIMQQKDNPPPQEPPQTK